jgi:hypothetical protein
LQMERYPVCAATAGPACAVGAGTSQP